jgi:GPH family glycoside/pentoside/hexuronide:cation symporter
LLAQGIVWITLQAMAVSGFTVLLPAFVAEVTDYDETLTGQRREGTYYATLGFVDHIANSITLAFLPLLLLLGRGQSDLHGPLGVRMVGIVGGVMMLAAFMLFLRYPFRRPPHKPERDPIRIGT